MDKYIKEIMPIITKTGSYIGTKLDIEKTTKLNDKLNKINKKLDNYKQELIYYYDKYKFIPSKLGYLYINQNNTISKGKEIKCFKIGYASNMKERLSGYKVGNFNHKILCYIPLDIDRITIESCIKNRNKPHLIKLVTDSICYMSLKELKEEVIDCIIFIKTHICHCLFCQKQYQFENLSEHKCNNIEKFVDLNIDNLIKDKPKGSKKVSNKGSKKVSNKGSKKVSNKGSKKVLIRFPKKGFQ